MRIRSLVLLTTCLFLLTQCTKDEVAPPPPSPPASTITDISPVTGQVGTTVVINGTNFGTSLTANVVKFNGVTAEVTQATATQLTVKAPSGSTGGKIEVTTNNKTTIGPDFKFYHIYAYGSKSLYAAYWIDGVATAFDTRGRIYSLVISGTDVYAVGFEAPNGVVFPAYWKNGVKVTIPGITDKMRLTGVAVSGSDVYICGTEFQASPAFSLARVWKNGSPFYTTDGSADASAEDIAVSGSDVYVAGREYPYATLWKNGVKTTFTDGTFAKRIKIIGSDIHIVGHESSLLRYWKNSNSIDIKNRLVQGVPVDFTFSGSDMYMSGYAYLFKGQHSNYTVARYWKNGNETELSDGLSDRFASSIEVTPDALLVLHSVSGGSISSAVSSILLKNNDPITPDYGGGATNGIEKMFIVYY